jgi:hypothetical protein
VFACLLHVCCACRPMYRASSSRTNFHSISNIHIVDSNVDQSARHKHRAIVCCIPTSLLAPRHLRPKVARCLLLSSSSSSSTLYILLRHRLGRRHLLRHHGLFFLLRLWLDLERRNSSKSGGFGSVVIASSEAGHLAFHGE